MSRKQQLQDQTVWRSDPHTAVKHLVYRHYLDCWMPKILQVFDRATIVDAFAGPGIYADGAPGSSILIARAFLEHRARWKFNNLDIVCLEQRPDRVNSLRAEVAKIPRAAGLSVNILPAGAFADQQRAISAIAHGDDPGRPVLWLLDPFAIKSLPFDLVRRCLAGSRDEVITTFFTHELHRFLTTADAPKWFNPVFGGDGWQQARSQRTEAARKNTLASAYLDSLRAADPTLHTGRFSVRVHNDTARYDLMFATHAAAGMDCWIPMKWRLDRYAGRGASASTVANDNLFGTSVTDPLRDALVEFAGTAQSWITLADVTRRLQFKETHLRSVLDELAADGMAVRIHPIKPANGWPRGCTVRFWGPGEADRHAAQLEDEYSPSQTPLPYIGPA